MTMIVLLAVLTAWAGLALVAVAVCVMAARADREQLVPAAPEDLWARDVGLVPAPA